jgi:hypothetical protein
MQPRRFIPALSFAALLVSSASTSGCMDPKGCWFGEDGNDECDGFESRCHEGTFQKCAGRTCDRGQHWSNDPCPSNAPFCVQVNDGTAECAPKPTCAATSKCTESGYCADGAEGCIATAEGCKRACTARRTGFCDFDGIAHCKPTLAGCQASIACENEGLCGVREDASNCAPTEAGCAASTGACDHSGECGFDPVLGCVASADGCAASMECQTEGKCGFEPPDACVATPDGCAASIQCADYGYCGVEGPLCTQTARGCRESNIGCQRENYCGFRDDRCAVE